MRFDIEARVHHDVHIHPTNEELAMANAALSTALSQATDTVSTLRSENASLSTVVADGAASVSTEVSAAVDAEDTAVASEIQSAVA